MTPGEAIPPSFYNRSALEVARDLIGARLVRVEDGVRISGRIIETEAYCGQEDLGCHAKAGLTPRTKTMFGPPGMAYVYFTYGSHWMFNCVCMPEGEPHAVLIRGIEPLEGIEIIAERRGKQPRKHWTDGPGKLTKALNIYKTHNGLSITLKDMPVFLEFDREIPDAAVSITPRIGLYSVPEPWKNIPWRFLADEQLPLP